MTSPIFLINVLVQEASLVIQTVTALCRIPRFDLCVGEMPQRRKGKKGYPLNILPLLGEFHRQRSLVAISPGAHKELNTTGATQTHAESLVQSNMPGLFLPYILCTFQDVFSLEDLPHTLPVGLFSVSPTYKLEYCCLTDIFSEHPK